MERVIIKTSQMKITTQHENQIFMLGRAYGVRAGAKQLIEMLHNEIKGSEMADAEIRAFIEEVWREICVEGTSFMIVPD